MTNKPQAETAPTQGEVREQEEKQAQRTGSVFSRLFGKRARHAAPKEGTFARAHMVAEFVSFVAIIFAVPIAVMEFHNHSSESESNHKRDRIMAAESTYRDAQAKYSEFLKLCLDHPRLDCYSVPENHHDLSRDEKIQQKVLYTTLTDAFEVAYVVYRTNQDLDAEAKEIFEQQWRGWDVYIRKFLQRAAYCQVYLEIRDEYDTRLVRYMDDIAMDTANKCSATPGQNP
jgi:hypothetical protein